MPRPRKPLSLAKTEGRVARSKGRFAGRNEHDSNGPLGDPPDYLQDTKDSKARTAWQVIAMEIPWLTRRDRALTEMASLVRGELMAGGFPGIQRLNLLRQILSQMGATPADATKVGAPSGDDDKKDEDDIFSQPR